MLYRFIKILLSLFTLIFVTALLVACDKENKKPPENAKEPIISTTASSTEAKNEKSEEETDAHIILDGEKTTINGNGVAFEKSTVKINLPGTYYFTGTLPNGKIYINTEIKDEKVKLIFDNVNISCSTDAPVYIENSPDETVIILKDGTQNYLKDTRRTVTAGKENYANATIYSKDNLQIEGKGILNIAAEFEKGIFTENGLDIRGGIINIKSKDDAIRGNDSVEISGGTLNLVCGGDGIRTNEEAEKGKGFISIDGAAINIESELDAIEAVTDLKINGGEITAKSGSGATGEFSLTENFPVNGRDFFRPDKNESQGEGLTITDEEAASQKGIKAGNSLMIEGGTLSLSSADDSLHGADITIEGDSFTLSSDNNAIYADNTLTVNGGNITVESSYEGLKATEIAVNGGYTLINADGNGLNSNSKALLKGGTVIIYGPENKGTSALDYSGSFTVSGGTLLATDSRNITQFVIGEGIRVLNINASSAANTISAITDQEGNCLVAFKSQKAFKNVIFASENIKDDAFYSFYSGGTINCEHNKKNGFCLDAEYTPGQLISNIY